MIHETFENVPGAQEHNADPGAANVIRDLRRQLGMTQEEFAQELGITVGTVSRWEQGRFRPSRLARTLLMTFARDRNLSLDLDAFPRHG